MSTQDEFVKDAKAQLDRWNAELKKMQAEAEKMSAEGQKQFKSQLDMIEARRAEAQATIEKIQKANMAAMQDMQKHLQEAWRAMEKGMAEARKHYMKD